MKNLPIAQDRLVEVRYLMRLLPHLQATMRIACGQAALSHGTPEVPPTIILHHADGASSLVCCCYRRAVSGFVVGRPAQGLGSPSDLPRRNSEWRGRVSAELTPVPTFHSFC